MSLGRGYDDYFYSNLIYRHETTGTDRFVQNHAGYQLSNKAIMGIYLSHWNCCECFSLFFFFCMFGNLHSPEWQRSLKIPSLLGNYHTDRFAHHYPWYFGASHSLIGRIQCCRCDRLFCCLQWPAFGKDCLLSFRTPLCIVFTGLLILAGLWLLTEYIRV